MIKTEKHSLYLCHMTILLQKSTLNLAILQKYKIKYHYVLYSELLMVFLLLVVEMQKKNHQGFDQDSAVNQTTIIIVCCPYMKVNNTFK